MHLTIFLRNTWGELRKREEEKIPKNRLCSLINLFTLLRFWLSVLLIHSFFLENNTNLRSSKLTSFRNFKKIVKSLSIDEIAIYFSPSWAAIKCNTSIAFKIAN